MLSPLSGIFPVFHLLCSSESFSCQLHRAISENLSPPITNYTVSPCDTLSGALHTFTLFHYHIYFHYIEFLISTTVHLMKGSRPALNLDSNSLPLYAWTDLCLPSFLICRMDEL